MFHIRKLKENTAVVTNKFAFPFVSPRYHSLLFSWSFRLASVVKYLDIILSCNFLVVGQSKKKWANVSSDRTLSFLSSQNVQFLE